MNRFHRWWPRLAGAALALLAVGPLRAADERSLEKVVLYLGWRAEPEYGGFFQALAGGIYRKYGLEPEIRLGNPQTNAALPLILNKVDFIDGSSGDVINYAQQGLPLVGVAGIFQKSPRVLIAHPGQGSDTLEQMKGKPILLGSRALTTVWPFLRLRYGFTDDQVRPYTFDEAPFLHNERAIQEGFITEEPFILGRLGVLHPVVVLLSVHGYQEYSMLLITSRDKVERRPDFVQRFVSASVEGWYAYLYGDATAGNAYLKANNPDMTDEQIAFSQRTMRDAGLIDSGDAAAKGIGAMTDDRWRQIYQALVAGGSVPAGLDLQQAYTTRFVNRRVGLKAPVVPSAPGVLRGLVRDRLKRGHEALPRLIQLVPRPPGGFGPPGRRGRPGAVPAQGRHPDHL